MAFENTNPFLSSSIYFFSNFRKIVDWKHSSRRWIFLRFQKSNKNGSVETMNRFLFKLCNDGMARHNRPMHHIHVFWSYRLSVPWKPGCDLSLTTADPMQQKGNILMCDWAFWVFPAFIREKPWSNTPVASQITSFSVVPNLQSNWLLQ